MATLINFSLVIILVQSASTVVAADSSYYESSTIALNDQGPKLARSWTVYSTGNQGAAEEEPSLILSDNSEGVQAKGALFYFPPKCDDDKSDGNKADKEDDDDEEEKDNAVKCTHKVVEKSIVLEDVPSNDENGEQQGNDNDKKEEENLSLGPPKIKRLPKKCEKLSDGSTMCEEKIISEYYLPTKEAEKELENILIWTHHGDSLFRQHQEEEETTS